MISIRDKENTFNIQISDRKEFVLGFEYFVIVFEEYCIMKNFYS